MNKSIEARKNEIQNDIQDILKSALFRIKKVIGVCPQWEVLDVSSGYNSMIVVLKLEGVETDRNIQIRYQAKTKRQDEFFETNVAACGSFDLLKDSDSLKYYTAIGELLNHKDMLSLLKDYMAFYTTAIVEFEKELNKLEED